MAIRSGETHRGWVPQPAAEVYIEVCVKRRSQDTKHVNPQHVPHGDAVSQWESIWPEACVFIVCTRVSKQAGTKHVLFKSKRPIVRFLQI